MSDIKAATVVWALLLPVVKILIWLARTFVLEMCERETQNICNTIFPVLLYEIRPGTERSLFTWFSLNRSKTHSTVNSFCHGFCLLPHHARSWWRHCFRVHAFILEQFSTCIVFFEALMMRKKLLFIGDHLWSVKIYFCLCLEIFCSIFFLFLSGKIWFKTFDSCILFLSLAQFKCFTFNF